MNRRPIETGEHNYTNPELDGLYDELLDPERPCLVFNRNLPHEQREALETEADCYRIRGLRGGLKFCYSPRSYQNMDRQRVRTLRLCVEQARPEWVEQVRMAMLMDNDVYTIVHLSGVPPYPAVAILENLIERNDLPDA